MIKLIINKETPSLNKINSMHWGSKHKLKQQWYLEILAAANGINRRCPTKDDKYKVVITRYATKILDHDNFVGGAKMILDDLKTVSYIKVFGKMIRADRYGFIYDDDPYRLNVQYSQVKSKKKQTVIEIYNQSGY